jgi:predicted RND superfamily exporter protein
MHVLMVQPADPRHEQGAILRLRECIELTRPEVPGVHVAITGEAVLRADEMKYARRDTEAAALIALGLTALLFVISCRAIRGPLLATLCLLIGVAYTLGFATVTVGRLNLLSVTLVPIVIGLAIDYGVHLLFRYEEQVRRGQDRPQAMRKALEFTGVGITTSALTIAGAFYFMAFTGFKGCRRWA